MSTSRQAAANSPRPGAKSPQRPLMTQAQYARRRRVSRQAVADRIRRGLLPTYGHDRRLNPEEADRWWHETTVRPEAAAGATVGPPSAFMQARVALLLTEVQLRRLRHEDRRSQLIARDAVLSKFALTMRAMREGFQALPARIAADLAADLGCARDGRRLEPAMVQRALEPYVQRQLDELADVRLDLTPAVRR